MYLAHFYKESIREYQRVPEIFRCVALNQIEKNPSAEFLSQVAGSAKKQAMESAGGIGALENPLRVKQFKKAPCPCQWQGLLI